jgi:citrate lyase subunit beta/citryl-CoA lyase
MVPKAQYPHHLAILAEIAADLARPRLIALVESPQGVAALGALAQVPAVAGLALGTEDFSLAMGWSLMPPCSIILAPAGAGGGGARADGAGGALLDRAFREEEASPPRPWRRGLWGERGDLHPSPAGGGGQCGVRHQRGSARRGGAILAAWDEAQAQGLSVASLGGRMIDLPVAERARRRLARR